MNSFKTIAVPASLVVAGGLACGMCACKRDGEPVPAAAIPANPAPVAETEYVAEQPIPPAAPVEVVPVSPGPDYVWIGGSYDWTGYPARWQWMPGRWERPMRPHAVWHEGEWHRDGHGYHWERGHWR